MEQLACRDERWHAGQALLAAGVDRQLRLGAGHRGGALAFEQRRALQREQATAFDPEHELQCRLDPLARVDRDRHHRQILGEREQRSAAHLAPLTETLRAPQQHTGREALGAVEVQQLVGNQTASAAIAFTKIGGQCQKVRVHR